MKIGFGKFLVDMAAGLCLDVDCSCLNYHGDHNHIDGIRC